jgi:hypothetical protein
MMHVSQTVRGLFTHGPLSRMKFPPRIAMPRTRACQVPKGALYVTSTVTNEVKSYDGHSGAFLGDTITARHGSVELAGRPGLRPGSGGLSLAELPDRRRPARAPDLSAGESRSVGGGPVRDCSAPAHRS